MLFNELVMSPHAVTEPVLKLVVLAMELDSGRYSAGSANCSALLYVLRVAVRVEVFVRVVLAAHDAQGALTLVLDSEGLLSGGAALAAVEEAHQQGSAGKRSSAAA